MCFDCGGLGIFRYNGVSRSHEGQVCYKAYLSLANQNYRLLTSVCIESTSVCIESTYDVYRNDFTCVSKRLRFVAKQLQFVAKRLRFVAKRLCSEATGYLRTYIIRTNILLASFHTEVMYLSVNIVSESQYLHYKDQYCVVKFSH